MVETAAKIRETTRRPDAQFTQDVEQAFATNAISVRFQPQVDIATGAIAGAEALARWPRDPQKDVEGQRLFALAGRAGQARALSEHVHRRAMAAALAWPGNLALSINITAADAVRPDFGVCLLKMADTFKFDPARLTVELTETELIENLDVASIYLARLRDEGIRVALDDFGTGYSSLLYLKSLPLDAIKLDKRLTSDIEGSERAATVVQSVIALGHSLGLTVIAEGVETEAQRALLAAEGCDLYQGYLCAPPLEAEAFAAMVGQLR